MIDLVYVTYNSEKWIDMCFTSLLNQNYGTKNLNVYVVDNNSQDDTLQKLEDFAKEYGNEFNCFSVLREKENWGFGKANNIGFQKGNSDIVCFLNIDTEVYEDTFVELMKDVEQSDDKVGVWEFRQFPYEHPKMYDVLTGETTWSSGAAFAVRRNVFALVEGFDEAIFMYAEDVDLSWRIRANGYILKYCPRVKIHHYSYESAGVIKPNQYVYSIVNNIMLRHRYADRRAILWGHYTFWKIVLKSPEPFKGSRKMLKRAYWKNLRNLKHFRANHIYKNKKVETFCGWDYAMIRDGAFYKNHLPSEKPLVSIIVRTCGRPSVLRETLISLRKQTYDNIEVVVVEDGKNISEEMIKTEFSDMNILYHATMDKVGRSKAGNVAMELAHGKYLNFLDDDDQFFADHVEVLVATLEKTDCKAAYATSFETPIEIKSKDPYVYEIKDYNGVHKQDFNRMMLCHHNYIPIQCIMFEKILFELYGGLDETVDALEDWDLWVRYAMYTDYEFVLKTTSIYRVPAKRDINEKRQKELDDALIVMRNKHKGYTMPMSVYDGCLLYEKIMMGQ